MRSLPFLILLSLSFSTFASTVELPRGGKIQFDQKKWLVLENKVTPELKSMIIFSKEEKELKGFILDGTIKEKGACKTAPTSAWKTCEVKQKVNSEIHHQIYLQRRIGKNSVQNYVLSFNYDPKREQTYSKLISQLKTSLETK